MQAKHAKSVKVVRKGSEEHEKVQICMSPQMSVIQTLTSLSLNLLVMKSVQASPCSVGSVRYTVTILCTPTDY